VFIGDDQEIQYLSKNNLDDVSIFNYRPKPKPNSKIESFII